MSIIDLPSSPDILAVTQEQMVMLVIHLATQIPREKLDPGFFDFEYAPVSDETVNVTFTGRTYSKNGQRGPWSGSKTIEITRARLNISQRPINLTVAYRNGMAFEHILRALEATYSFKVTATELLLKNTSTGSYEPFLDTSRPTGTVLEFKFSQNQARIIPTDSEFTVTLDNSGRPDINDYLHLIKAGSIVGGA